jgi:uncharacterized surface anchored protein
MTLFGDASRTTTTDANGNYSFNNLLPGSYIITPSKPGYTFSPTGRSVTISNANISGQDFTALVILPTVCTGVTVTSSPSSVTYTNTKKNQTKYIYVTITNNSGASRIVTTIASSQMNHSPSEVSHQTSRIQFAMGVAELFPSVPSDLHHVSQ